LTEPVDNSTTKLVNVSDPSSIHYYNFAPIRIGGTTRAHLLYKKWISQADFLHINPDSTKYRSVPGAAGITAPYCVANPTSPQCVYGRPSHDVLANLGFGDHEAVEDNVIHVGGITIGMEICLDHKRGELCNRLGPDGTVDVQLVASEGMNIARGPVCTKVGGPAFLSDGHARTELTQNDYGTGRVWDQEWVAEKGGLPQYAVGISYGSDSLVDLQQWMADVIYSYTDQSWGPRAVGEGTLAGGSLVDGVTKMPFKRVPALGDDWEAMLEGFFPTSSYTKAQRMYKTILDSETKEEAASNAKWVESVPPPQEYPTIDIYGPVFLIE